MQINSLNINNLRNIEAADFNPHPRLNLLYGSNGAGKTSVLEAIVVLAKGRSFRSGNVAALIGPASDALRVVARIEGDGGQSNQLGLERGVKEWRGRIDGEDVQRFSELSACLPLVLLEPNSHLLVSGPPDGRRKFLDWGVFHVKHGHLSQWRRYARALRQRNAALRSGDRGMAQALDEQLVRHGDAIHIERRKQVQALEQFLANTLRALSPGLGEIHMVYEPGWTGDSLAEHLAVTLDRDLERGSTLAGPHRADLEIRHQGKGARERLSRGEQKLVAAALLLAQAEVIASNGPKPLLLLDDLASEFDPRHLHNVLELGQRLAGQAWITGTSPSPYIDDAPPDGEMFHVKHGEIGPGNPLKSA